MLRILQSYREVLVAWTQRETHEQYAYHSACSVQTPVKDIHHGPSKSQCRNSTSVFPNATQPSSMDPE